MIIDAKNLILGRLAAFVAKQALLNEEVKVLNCKEAVIIGKRQDILSKYKQKQQRTTPRKGPFTPKLPFKLVKRTIRGMLPYKKTHGRLALKRVCCYNSFPEIFKNEKIHNLDKFNVHKTHNTKFIKIEEVCKYLGGK